MIRKRGLVAFGSAVALAAAMSGGAWAQGGSAAPPAAGGKAQAKAQVQAEHATRSVVTNRRSERVEAVQRALNQHGADLKVDGHSGPTTRAALKKFQADNGLKATGRIDKATLDKLGVK